MPQKQTVFLTRLLIVVSAMLCLYSYIAVHLWFKQMRHGEEYRKKISQQSIRRIRIPAARGRIFSSDGKVLADNVPSYSVVLHPAEMRQPGRRKKTIAHILATAKRIAAAVGRKSTIREDMVVDHLNRRPALPMTLFSNLSIRELTAASEMMPPVKGMEIVTEPQRCYLDGEMVAHVLGFVVKEDPELAEDRDEYFAPYYNSDYTGGGGIEKRFDKDFDMGEVELPGLRGAPGNSLVQVDYRGFIHSTLETPVAPKRGNDIVLTINWEAQRAADEAFEGKKGAVVVLDARTGAVLVMLSKPAYDPNLFIPRIKPSEWNSLNQDRNRPLVNRALCGEYMPGSIIKPLIALSSLENGYNPAEKLVCEGGVNVGNTPIRCWNYKTGGHDELDLVHAIEQSCNVFFIRRGRMLGMDSICRTLRNAGIGQGTGIPLPESRGLAPSREFKMKAYREKWTEYDTALLSIGQGIILVTPLQAALYAAAIANGGDLLQPYIVEELRDGGGVLYRREEPVVRNQISWDKALTAVVRSGMDMAVNGEKGTAKKSRNDRIRLCGKTGTAEVGPADKRTKNTWFIGFGEREGRLYSIAIVVEGGISGGTTSAPVAKALFEKWFPPPPAEEEKH